jgi:DNA/RNA endonuclease YhcR with UshA esterase domain
MNDAQLMRLCFLGAFAGIAAIYIASLYIEPGQLGAGEVTADMAGISVKVTGEVIDLYIHKNGHIFFSVRDDTGKVRVVLWQDEIEMMELYGFNRSLIRNGVYAEVTGAVEMYRGEPEIIPTRGDVKFTPAS